MPVMNVSDLRKLDLNLLVIFYVVMRERSATRTAAVLHMTQSSVSASLRRLRNTFGDELFVRTRTGLVPTPRALELSPQVSAAIGAVLDVVSPQADTAVVPDLGHTFTLAMSDDIESLVAPRILSAAQADPVRPRFAFYQTNSALWEGTIEDGRIDAVLVAQSNTVLAARYRQAELFSSSYSCIYDARRFDLPVPMDQDTFVSMNHLRISFNGRRGILDDVFESLGFTRHVIGTFTHFAGALSTLSATRCVLSLPTFAAQTMGTMCGLAISEVPVSMPRFSIVLIWRIESENNPLHRWLQNFVMTALKQV